MLSDPPAHKDTATASPSAKKRRTRPEWPFRLEKHSPRSPSIDLKWLLSTFQVSASLFRRYRSDIEHLRTSHQSSCSRSLPTLLFATTTNQDLQLRQRRIANKYSSFSLKRETRKHKNDDFFPIRTQIYGTTLIPQCLLLGEPHNKLLFVDTFKNKALA